MLREKQFVVRVHEKRRKTKKKHLKSTIPYTRSMYDFATTVPLNTELESLQPVFNQRIKE